MYGDEDIAQLALTVGLVPCILLVFLLGPVILRAACHLCDVEVPVVVRAFWVSLGCLFLSPMLGKVFSLATGFIGSRLGEGIMATFTLSLPQGIVTGGPLLGNVILFVCSWLTGADVTFSRPLFTKDIIVSPGVDAAQSTAHLSLLGSFVNLNVIMIVTVGVYHRYLGLTFAQAFRVWLVDLFLKFEVFGFIVLFVMGLVRIWQ